MIFTISDSRDEKSDRSGLMIRQFLNDEGHKVIGKKIIPDDQEMIKTEIEAACANEEVDIVLTNGGTGIAYRDVTIETVERMFDKHIPGFGELFRMLSYKEDIGSSAIMSRATAGLINHKAVFSLPGSSGAVQLAMKKLIIPELSHILYEIQKDHPI